MDRKVLGEKISENLAIQGQIEDAKAKLLKFRNEKNDADSIVEKGREAETLASKLAAEIETFSANLETLESDLAKSDEELSAANARVPRLINETKPPVHMRF